MSPFDLNAAVLSNIAAQGRDLTIVRFIDFEHLFQEREAAETFAHQAASLGFQTKVRLYGDDENWNVTVSKNMVPSCEQITAVEQQLDVLAHQYGGYADGWGFLSAPNE